MLHGGGHKNLRIAKVRHGTKKVGNTGLNSLLCWVLFYGTTLSLFHCFRYFQKLNFYTATETLLSTFWKLFSDSRTSEQFKIENFRWGCYSCYLCSVLEKLQIRKRNKHSNLSITVVPLESKEFDVLKLTPLAAHFQYTLYLIALWWTCKSLHFQNDVVLLIWTLSWSFIMAASTCVLESWNWCW